MGKETLGDKENNKTVEIESFFEKIKKVPYGEISVLVLEKFADKKTLKISKDEEYTRVCGKCTPFDELNPPIIEITYSNKGASLFETIYRNEDDLSNNDHTGGFFNIPTSVINNNIVRDSKIDFHPHRKIREEMDLSNSYKRFVYKIGGFISSSIDEYEAKKANNPNF